MWTGMDTVHWFRLLAVNRFAVNPIRIPMACILSGISVANTCLNGIEAALYHRKIAETEIEQDPVFILGHWRTGTTWLHELLVLDPRHTSPTTYECFGSSHFLLSERFIKWWLDYLMPRRRPMDNVAVGLDRPQEDEFAFCGLGVPSPYLDWAFANRPPQHQDYLDLRNITPEAREKWKQAFLWFLKSVACKNPDKRIILKSPTHTYRVRTILEIFPQARFVYLVRDPFVVFPSTVNTWKRLTRYHGAQLPKHRDLDRQVFERFERMFEVFEEDRQLIEPGHLCELRYEDLARDPMAEVQAVYERLALGDFTPVREPLEKYLASLSDYKKNRYEISPELKAEIRRRWAPYFEKYGYSTEPDEG
jgi:hypothetical protein